jgi:hypothetical protein
MASVIKYPKAERDVRRGNSIKYPKTFCNRFAHSSQQLDQIPEDDLTRRRLLQLVPGPRNVI